MVIFRGGATERTDHVAYPTSSYCSASNSNFFICAQKKISAAVLNCARSKNTMRVSTSLVAAGALILGAACWASCGGNRQEFGNDGSVDAAADVFVPPDDAYGFGEIASPDAAACRKCSGDLHSVLDCDNNVVTTAPDDQGCGAGGQCAAACQAAPDNKSPVACDYYSVDVGTDDEA